ncbi:MAG: AI-2E family transporter [Clostridia bacterium]|nr:AI-2E family transporter [Clostridia bacterium]
MKIEWKSCFKAGISIFVLFLCIHYWLNVAGVLGALVGAAAPLFIGCVIAYLINILMSFYEKHYFPKAKKRFLIKSRRPICLLGAVLTLITIVLLILKLVVPQLTSCVQVILSAIPNAIGKILSYLKNVHILPEDILASLSAIDWRSRAEEIFTLFTSGIGNVTNIVVGVVSSVFSGIVTTIVSVIFSIYLLTGKEKVGGQINRLMQRYIKHNWYKKIMHVLTTMHDCFRRYIIGQCTEAIILGLLCTLGMWLLKLPYAPMIGALTAFTALIPVAGGYIGAGIGAFMILTQSPIKALIFLIFIVILQQLEGNLIYPKVVGSSMGLPGIWVLAAVTIGGGLMGIFGMLLGVPMAATVYRLLREDVHNPSAKDRDKENKEIPKGDDSLVKIDQAHAE